MALWWPLQAHALVLPDPSGTYEGQCAEGQNLFPVACDSQPTPRPLRSKAHLFAVSFDPGDCSTNPCNPPPKTQVEGQIVVARSYVQNVWDADEQRCKPATDPGYTYIGDVFDVSGTVTWTNLDTGANQLSLTGVLVSDPGPATYIPAMNFTGTVLTLRRPEHFSTTVIGGCMNLVGLPALQMTMQYAAPAIEPGPMACTAGTGFPTSHCWRRLSGPLPSASGTIRGNLVSLVPTHTETDNEVHQATIIVYEQTGGAVREKLAEESDDAYEQHLVEMGRREIRRIQIERTRDGTYTFGAPGRFEIPDIPAFRFRSQGDGRWGTMWYTLEVEGAETDERIPLEGNLFDEERLLFRRGRAINVRPEQVPVTIGLDGFGEIGVKEQLIERLSEMCVLHYAPVELAAQTFLNEADDELSEELAEAIQRGAWAERAVLTSRALADELIEVSLAGLAALLGDLYDDLHEYHRADIAFMRNNRERLEKQVDPLSSQSFQIDAGDFQDTAVTALLDRSEFQLLAQSDLASMAKKAVKGLKPVLVFGLGAAGVQDADGVAEKILTAIIVLADSIETRTKMGAGKEILKIIIIETVQLAKLPLLDVSPLSYCGLTEDALQSSVDQMSMWNQSDETIYVQDRRVVVDRISRMNREASNILARMRAAQEVAAGFDTVQDAAEVVGTFIKFFKAVEKFALVTKYVLNAESAVLPFVQAFGEMPGMVDGAVAAAFANGAVTGQVAANDGGAAERAPARAAAPRAAVTVDHGALTAVLTQIDLALADSRLGDLIGLMVDVEASSYIVERDRHTRALQALLAQAGAAGGTFGLAAPQRDVSNAWATLQMAQAELAETLRSLIVDAWSGVHKRTTDAGYIRARDVTRALVGTVKAQLTTLATEVQKLREAVDSNGIGQVVLLEVLPPLSATTGEAMISTSPETFTLRVRVMNLGDAPLAGLSLRVVADSPSDSLTVQGAEELSVGSGTLAAFDGLDNDGGDETTVEFPLVYDGDLSWEIVTVGGHLLHNGGEPDGIATADATRILPFDADATDQDRDTMPDDYEAEFGLNPAADDGKLDLDDDGLSNLAELRLGTDPSVSDSDEDGLADGTEVVPAVQGFATDPLDADTDDDGTDDGADLAPLDSTSTSAPEPAAEPAVALSRTLIVLTQDTPVAVVEVTNAGEGTLLWSAMADQPSLLQLSPGTGDVRSEEALLFVAAAGGVDFDAVGAVVTEVTVTDAAGTVRDSQRVKIVFGGNSAAAVCGHGSEATIGSTLKATDALATLRAAVGTFGCDACRCDVDDSGSLTATDALRVLRAAVGIPTELTCPAC